MDKPIEKLLEQYEPNTSTAKYASNSFDNSPTTKEESDRLLGEILTDLMKKGYSVESYSENIDISTLTPTQGIDKKALDHYEKVYSSMKKQNKQIPPIIVLRYEEGIEAIADGHHRCAALFYRMSESIIPAYVVNMPSEVEAEESGAKTFADLSEEELYYESSEIEI